MDFGLDEIAPKQGGRKPTSLEYMYYIFLEKGIDFYQFNKLPIPYILNMLDTQDYRNKLEEQEMKKAQRR
jgi:hypothetical protein